MSEIKKQLVSGVFYTAIAKYVGIIFSIVIAGVLSRLLTPEEYGIVVPVTVLVTFFGILGDIGIGPAIIQNSDMTKEDTSSIFSFTIIVAFVLATVFFSASWVVASIYESDIMISLTQLLAISVFFFCANIVPNALLYQAKKFRFLAIRSLIVQAISGAMAMVTAFLGAGVYALVFQSIITSIMMFIISYRENPLKLRLLHINWEPLKKIRSFSSYQFLFNVLNYFSVNLDKLIISKYLGAADQGYYEKSYRLMHMPLQNIPYIITPVMHPIFAEMQNDLVKMRVYYSKVLRFLAFIGFPLSVLLYFTGEDILLILFGSQWGPSVPVFKLLALSVGFQILLSTSGSIFQSARTTHLLLLCGVLSTITTVVAILVGVFVFGNLEAIGFLLSCSFVINFFTTFSIMYCVLFKSGIMPFIKQIISPLILSAILTVVLYYISPLVEGLNAIISLLILGSIALCICFSYIQLTKEYNILQKVFEYTSRLRRKQ